MIGKLDVEDRTTTELIKRIVVRMGDQTEPEILHVFSKLFPNSPVLRIKSVAQDLAGERINAENEFMNLLGSDEVDIDVFNSLSSAEQDPNLIMSRAQYDPTKFELTLVCHRTPFKEFFDECKSITCEDCISSRITNFQTENPHSKSPWEVNVARVEGRRVDLCKACGQMLGKNDEINMQNERLLYKCSYCGHRGWTKAK